MNRRAAIGGAAVLATRWSNARTQSATPTVDADCQGLDAYADQLRRIAVDMRNEASRVGLVTSDENTEVSSGQYLIRSRTHLSYLNYLVNVEAPLWADRWHQGRIELISIYVAMEAT